MKKISPFDMPAEDNFINFIDPDNTGNYEEIEEEEDTVLIENIDSTEEEEETEEDTVEDTNETEEEKDEQGSDSTGSTNPISILAKSFKEDGFLPDDIEIPDNITDVQFAELYRTSKEELIRNEIRQELIEKEGLNPEILATAKKIHLGIAPKEIEQLNLFTGLASINFDENSDNYEEVASQYLNFYYRDINFDDALIERQIERDLNSDSDDLTQVLTVAKRHFANKAKSTKEAHDLAVKNEEDRRVKEEKEKIDNMEKLLSAGVIKGVKYSKSDMEKVRKALFDKSEIYVDKEGKKHRVTLYQKRRMDIASDFEYSFKQIVDVVLGPKEAKSGVELEEKAKRSILSDLNKAVSSVPTMSGKGNSDNISKYGKKAFSI